MVAALAARTHVRKQSLEKVSDGGTGKPSRGNVELLIEFHVFLHSTVRGEPEDHECWLWLQVEGRQGHCWNWSSLVAEGFVRDDRDSLKREL